MEKFLVSIPQGLKLITVSQMSELLPGGSLLSETLGPAIYSPERGWVLAERALVRVTCQSGGNSGPQAPLRTWSCLPLTRVPPFGLLPASPHGSHSPPSTCALHSSSLSSVSLPVHKVRPDGSRPNTKPLWLGSNAK